MAHAARPQPAEAVSPVEPDLRVAATAVRGLVMDAVQEANSGHPGMPMGMADAAVVLWARFLNFNPCEPAWPDRDRFVLSAGHGSMLLYALLHLSGYDLALEDLKRFRQWGSRTPGHPERGLTPGVETTTGPLGQGIGNAVGMALAERWLAERFNRPGFEVVDHLTYVIASDGDLMEGVSHEACALAGHLGLGKLIVLYDDNGITIDGPTALAFTETVVGRFAAYRWQTWQVDGHDCAAVAAALSGSLADRSRPALIACKTRIGYGSPHREGTSKAHGEPLGRDEVRLTKLGLGMAADSPFEISGDANAVFRRAAERGARAYAGWDELMSRYEQAHPKLAREFRAALSGELPADWDRDLPAFPAGTQTATRAASGAVLGAIAPRLPTLIGGSADLTPSNNTQAGAALDRAVRRNDFSGRYVHFGVREHGMGSILNGLALHGGMRAYGGTFLVFSDYMRPPIRMAAMMHLPVIFIFTHDSIGLGEDGPTHQPVEHLTGLRAIPNLSVLRPADATETVEAWRAALRRSQAPSALLLTRQPIPVLDRSKYAPAAGVARGAYVLADVEDAQVILIGTGSEVHVALEAQQLLAVDGIRARVVSMPCMELFDMQETEYRESVLPPAMRARVAVEAGATCGWGRYVGLDGTVVGLDRFGASAPAATLYRELGLSAEAVVNAARSALERAAGRP
jgi:transketolase